MPLAVTVFLFLDIVSTLIGQAYGVADLGPTGWLPAAQRFLVLAAAASAMWDRPRAAVVLSAGVAALVFTVGPCGMELWLVLITCVTAAARARRQQLALVVLAEIGYAAGFGWQAERRYPGEGWAAGPLTLAFAAAALGVGLVARRLLAARDRRRLRVQQLEREQSEIRAMERARLADDLQVVVTEGLARIEEDLDAAAERSADVQSLRAALTRVDAHTRSLLNQLRTLLDVLRRVPDQLGGAAGVREAGPRRWVELLTARHVRLAGTAVCCLLAARTALGLGSSPDVGVVVQVIGLLACAAAMWRPVAGAACAALALGVTTVFGPSSYWDGLSVSLLCLMSALRFGLRRIVLVVLAVAGYGALLAVLDPEDPRSHVARICYVAFLGIAVGLTMRHFLAAREESLRQLVELARDRDRVESEERTALARELHDVVAHSLSMTTLVVMATSLSDDPCRLRETLDTVRRSTEAAHHELSTLLYAMRGPDPAQSPTGPLVTPLAGSAALAQRLTDNGYRPVLDIDPAADRLDPTTQRTLGRIMQEAATNILRYTPAGSTCHFTLSIDGEGVRLSIVSPLGTDQRNSDLSLGWGLRGIRERVELTRGTFRAGPDRGRWVLDITLPVLGAALDGPSAPVGSTAAKTA